MATATATKGKAGSNGKAAPAAAAAKGKPKGAGGAKAKAEAARPLNKAGLIDALAAETELSKPQCGAFLRGLEAVIAAQLEPPAKGVKGGPGVFVLPGLVKITREAKQATKAKQGINPFTKEPMTIAAKPAHYALKLKALGALGEMVGGKAPPGG